MFKTPLMNHDVDQGHLQCYYVAIHPHDRKREKERERKIGRERKREQARAK